MKKLIVLTTLLLLISCSKPETIELDKTKGSKVYKLTNSSVPFSSLGLIDYKTKGMHYKIFQISDGGIDIINVTLDSLNVAKLKQDIKNGSR